MLSFDFFYRVNKAVQTSAYRKLVMRQEGYADRSDGLAYIITEKQYEICVIEGSRPYVVDDTKEMSDFAQNARAGKDIINYTVVSEVKLKRAPPLQFTAYMVQSIELSLRFYFMDYLGIYIYKKANKIFIFFRKISALRNRNMQNSNGPGRR